MEFNAKAGPKKKNLMFDWFLSLRVIHRQRETCPSSLSINTHKEVQNQNGHEPVEQTGQLKSAMKQVQKKKNDEGK